MNEKISIALAIPHAPWRPERVATMRRLRAQLFEGTDRDPSLSSKMGVPVQATPVGSFVEFTEPGPVHCSVWSEKIWTWAETTTATHLLVLQDDAIIPPAPFFWRALRAMLEHVPDRVIGLQAIHPYAVNLARVGCNAYETQDMLPGVAYVLPREMLVRFNEWRREHLRTGAELRVNEDMLLALFCATHAIRIWHPIPTIVDHDSSVPSLYGHDGHAMRNPSVIWDDIDDLTSLMTPDYWAPRAEVPYLGRFYTQTPLNFTRWVKWFDGPDHGGWAAAVERIESDVAPLGRPVDLKPRDKPPKFIKGRGCWSCGERPPIVAGGNGIALCSVCIAGMAGTLLASMMPRPAQPSPAPPVIKPAYPKMPPTLDGGRRP